MCFVLEQIRTLEAKILLEKLTVAKPVSPVTEPEDTMFTRSLPTLVADRFKLLSNTQVVLRSELCSTRDFPKLFQDLS
jgi:hypothetical protein